MPFVIGCNNGGGGGGDGEEDSPEVTKEEFGHACNFEGVKLMQANLSTIQLIESKSYINNFYFEISDLNYHGIETNDYDKYSDYWEHYAKIEQLGDEQCTYVERHSSDDNWSTPAIDDADEYCFRPEFFNPLSTEYIAKHVFTPSLEYDNFKLVENEYVYIGTTIEDNKECDARMELTFVNKALMHSLFTVNNELQNKFEFTYQYENIIPEWPIPE